MKKNVLALALTVLMMLSLLTAYPFVGLTGSAYSAEYGAYTVVATDLGDGTVKIVVAIPEGGAYSAGKVLVNVDGGDLTLVSGSLEGSEYGLANEDYDRDGYTGAFTNFAHYEALPAGTPIFTATYTLAEGASLDADDYSVSQWLIYDRDEDASYTQADGEIVERLEYTVSFVDYDGTLINKQVIAYGEAAVAPAAPMREGYTFAGWDKAYTNVTTALTVTAKYDINLYTVTFIVDGDVVLEDVVEHGASATAPVDPVKKGYTFIGWDKAFDNVTEDLTVTAQWKINTYTVTFMVDGAVYDEQTVNYGSDATEPDAPIKEGYTFAGWDVSLLNITEDTVINALWTTNTYTVVFVVDSKTVSTQTVEYGKAAAAPADPEKAGHTFAGWDKSFDNITANTTVTAKWNVNTYTVTFVVDGVAVSTQTVEYGKAAVAPTAPTKDNYEFAGWDKAFNNITGDITVNALWTTVRYTVTFVVDGEVYATADIGYGISWGAIALPDAPTKNGYVFAGWDGAPETITGAVTVTASFELFGDVNFDGKVDCVDAAWVLMHDVGIMDFDSVQLLCGDVIDDGIVDNQDALQILRYDADLIESL